MVTGYLIGDDSVMQKRRGRKMGSLGHHYSCTAEKTVSSHCLVQVHRVPASDLRTFCLSDGLIKSCKHNENIEQRTSP